MSDADRKALADAHGKVLLRLRNRAASQMEMSNHTGLPRAALSFREHVEALDFALAAIRSLPLQPEGRDRTCD